MLKKLIFSLFFVLLIFINAPAQINFEQDLSLILKSENSKIREIETERNRKREFLIAKDAPLVEKLNPVRWTLGGGYFISTRHPCRNIFQPIACMNHPVQTSAMMLYNIMAY
jgi:hypothetical protein